MALSKKLLREYDRFGPWIEEIHTEEDIPEQFMSHFKRTDDMFIAFKVPHPIERRKVRPGDPLYDHIMALDDTSISVFHRTPEGITSRSVVYEDIVGIATLSDLLQGALTVHTTDGSVEIPFNTVSQKTIDRTVRFLEERCGGTRVVESREAKVSPIPSTDVTDEMAPLYRNLYREEYRNGEIEAIAYQPDIMLERREPSLWEKFIDIVWRPRLRPAMILLAGQELIVYRAAPQIVSRSRGYYGYERVYVPPKRLKDVTTGRHGNYHGVTDLVLSADQKNFRVTFGSDYPLGTVIERLKSLVP